MNIKKFHDYLSWYRSRHKKNGQKGAALAEFAIILPLLLLLVFGIIEFGLILYNKQVITNASREGARSGIVAKLTRMTVTQIEDIVLNYAEDNLVNFGDKLVRDDITVPAACAQFEDELTVDVAFDYNFLVLGALLPSRWETIQLRATTVMICE